MYIASIDNGCPPGTIPDEAGTCIGIVKCPIGTALDPVSMTCITEKVPFLSGNTLTYILIGAIALFLLMGRK